MLTFSLILLLGYAPGLDGGHSCPPSNYELRITNYELRIMGAAVSNQQRVVASNGKAPIARVFYPAVRESEEVARQIQGSNGLHHDKVFPNERRPLQENMPRLASEAWTQSIGSVDSTTTNNRTLNTWRRWVLPVGVTVGVGTVVFLLYSLRGR